jgi:uncharacterized membrane protein
VTAFVTAAAGFLLAVLWFDLMFDVQVLRRRDAPGPAVESIAAYYRRVTADARPMNLLVGAAMAALLVGIALQLAGDDAPAWVGWTSLALAVPAIALAALHTYPAAVRLGERRDAPAAQAALARSILRDHLLCLPAIAALLAVQLAAGG